VGAGIETMGIARDRPIFWLPPINLGTSNATDFKFGIWQVHSQDASKLKPIKIWKKRERVHIQGLSNILGIPIISGTGKATDFKFCMHIHRINQNKSP